MSIDYDDLINRTWEDIPEPELLPNGGWMLEGGNVSLIKPKEKGKSSKVLFSYKAKEPVSVPDDLLEEMGNYDFSINDLNFTIYLENASDWDKVRKHLELHGIELNKKDRLVNEAGKLSFAKDFRGSKVIGDIRDRNYENADGVTIWQNSVSKFQRVEA